MTEVILKRATATRCQTSSVENHLRAAEAKTVELETDGAAPPSNTHTTLPGSTNNPELCKSQFSLTTGWGTKALHHLQDETTMRQEFNSVQMLGLAFKRLPLQPQSTRTFTDESLLSQHFQLILVK